MAVADGDAHVLSVRREPLFRGAVLDEDVVLRQEPQRQLPG